MQLSSYPNSSSSNPKFHVVCQFSGIYCQEINFKSQFYHQNSTTHIDGRILPYIICGLLSYDLLFTRIHKSTWQNFIVGDTPAAIFTLFCISCVLISIFQYVLLCFVFYFQRRELVTNSGTWDGKVKSQEKKILAKTSKQIKKEKRSGLFKQEQVGYL